MVAHADNLAMTEDQIWEEVQKDRALLVALFYYERHNAIASLLYRVRSDLVYDNRKKALKRPLERRAAMVATAFQEAEKREEEHQRALEMEAQRKADAEFIERMEAWKATAIGRLEIGGTPVWQCTPGTARAWLGAQRQRWRCVELLIEGLPDDGRTIEYYRRPEEVEELWKLSQGEWP